MRFFLLSTWHGCGPKKWCAWFSCKIQYIMIGFGPTDAHKVHALMMKYSLNYAKLRNLKMCSLLLCTQLFSLTCLSECTLGLSFVFGRSLHSACVHDNMVHILSGYFCTMQFSLLWSVYIIFFFTRKVQCFFLHYTNFWAWLNENRVQALWYHNCAITWLLNV